MRTWIHAAGIRAIKTMAQTALAMTGSAMVLAEIDWLMVLSGTILAGVLSMLTSVAGLPELKKNEECEYE